MFQIGESYLFYLMFLVPLKTIIKQFRKSLFENCFPFKFFFGYLYLSSVIKQIS